MELIKCTDRKAVVSYDKDEEKQMMLFIDNKTYLYDGMVPSGKGWAVIYTRS